MAKYRLPANVIKQLPAPAAKPSYKLPKTKPIGKITVGEQYQGREGVTLFKVAKSLFFGK